MLQIREIHYTPDFKKDYERLPKNIQKIVDRKDGQFRKKSIPPDFKDSQTKRTTKRFVVFLCYEILSNFI